MAIAPMYAEITVMAPSAIMVAKKISARECLEFGGGGGWVLGN